MSLNPLFISPVKRGEKLRHDLKRHLESVHEKALKVQRFSDREFIFDDPAYTREVQEHIAFVARRTKAEIILYAIHGIEFVDCDEVICARARSRSVLPHVIVEEIINDKQATWLVDGS